MHTNQLGVYFPLVYWSHFFFHFHDCLDFCLESQKWVSHTEPVFSLSHFSRHRTVPLPSWVYNLWFLSQSLSTFESAPPFLLAVSSAFGLPAAWLVSLSAENCHGSDYSIPPRRLSFWWEVSTRQNNTWGIYYLCSLGNSARAPSSAWVSGFPRQVFYFNHAVLLALL